MDPEHLDLAVWLNNRAMLLREIFLRIQCLHHNQYIFITFQGKLDAAGPLYDRSLAIRKKALGPDHPAVATVLNNRAGLLASQVRAVTILQGISCDAR